MKKTYTSSFRILTVALCILLATNAFQSEAFSQPVMTEVIQVTSSPFNGLTLSGSPSMVSMGDNIYITWHDTRANGSGDIMLAVSQDGGLSFTEAGYVYTVPDEEHMWPSLAVDQNGVIYVCWNGPMFGAATPHLWVSRSLDGGTTFQEPVTVISGKAMVFPSIATHGEHVYIFYTSVEMVNDKPMADYYFVRSTDQGQTFSDPVRVNDAESLSGDISISRNTSMFIDDAGIIYLAWNDGRREDGEGDIYFARSDDAGETFSDNVLVNLVDATTANNKYYMPSVQVDSQNRIYISFIEFDPVTDEDTAWLVQSTDGGQSFSDPAPLAGYTGYAKYVGMGFGPEDYVAVAMCAHDVELGNSVWLYISQDGGQTFEEPVSVSIINQDVYPRDVHIQVNLSGDVDVAWVSEPPPHEQTWVERNVYFRKFINKEMFAGGQGTEEDPFIIKTADHLNHLRYWLGHEHADKHFLVDDDIDLGVAPWNEGKGWVPIGNMWDDYFSGTLDGGGYRIKNLTIDRPDEEFVGLFRYISKATIKNMLIDDVHIVGEEAVGALTGLINGHDAFVYEVHASGHVESTSMSDAITGGLIGNANDGPVITYCSFVGLVEGKSYMVGGLLGEAYDNVSIVNSFAAGEVRGANETGGLVGLVYNSLVEGSFNMAEVYGTSYVGGLVGFLENGAVIRNAYSSGHVSGHAQVGGLVGINDESQVQYAYSTGKVSGQAQVGGLIGFNQGGTVSDSYWNMFTSEQAQSAGGTGKTTPEMVLQSSFENWDFPDTWEITEGESYPYLEWQWFAWLHNIPDKYPLTLVSQPGGAGILEVMPDEEDYFQGVSVEISAQANEGYVFLDWRDHGLLVSTEPVFEYTMPGKSTILTARFTTEDAPLYSVSALAEPEGSGTFGGEGQYEEGEEVRLEAIPAAGYIFVKWVMEDETESTENPIVFDMPAENMVFTAHFREIVHAVIDPDVFEFSDFEDDDFQEGMHTTVTWNDATEVKRVYVYVDEMQVDFYFSVEDIDGETARLTMMVPAKSQLMPNSGNLEIEGRIVFDVGDAAAFHLIFTSPRFDVEVRVLDDDTNAPIQGAIIYVQETSDTHETLSDGWADFTLPPGDYLLNISATGYDTIEDFEITVENAAGQEYRYIVHLKKTDDTGLPPLLEDQIIVYPNPATDRVYIRSHQDVPILSVRVMDMLGQIIYRTAPETAHYELGLSGVKPGIYFIEVVTMKGSEVHRLQLIR